MKFYLFMYFYFYKTSFYIIIQFFCDISVSFVKMMLDDLETMYLVFHEKKAF